MQSKFVTHFQEPLGHYRTIGWHSFLESVDLIHAVQGQVAQTVFSCLESKCKKILTGASIDSHRDKAEDNDVNSGSEETSLQNGRSDNLAPSSMQKFNAAIRHSHSWNGRILSRGWRVFAQPLKIHFRTHPQVHTGHGNYRPPAAVIGQYGLIYLYVYIYIILVISGMYIQINNIDWLL